MYYMSCLPDGALFQNYGNTTIPVSISVGNPWQALTGFKFGGDDRNNCFVFLVKYAGVLSKSGGTKVHLVVSSGFS